MERFVYVIRSSGGFYKVGVASDVVKRIKALQTANPQPIELVCARHSSSPYELEKRLHRYLAEHRSGGGTEWFKLSPEVAIEAVVMLYEGAHGFAIPDVELEERALDVF